MIHWAADKLTTVRRLGWGWRILGGGIAILAIVVGALIVAWRRWADAQHAHAVFVAEVDARAAADAARAAADQGKVGAFQEQAQQAQQRAEVAAGRARDARRKHDEDLAAIARVRSWRDVRPR